MSERRTTIEDPKGRPIVMIAVDDSKLAEHAFNWYIREAHRPEHKVLILHCINQTVHMGGYTDSVYAGLISKSHNSATDIKHKYGRLLKEKQIGGEFLSALHARPAEWLLEQISRHNPILVVMGTRGNNPLRRTIMGSVSSTVLHHAHCAVAVCHADDTISA